MADDYVSYVRDRNTGVVKEIHDEGARTDISLIGRSVPRSASEHVNTVTDMCYVDLQNRDAEVNQPTFINVSDSLNQLQNCPYAEASYFQALRIVDWYDVSNISVRLFEQFPVAGRVWQASYNNGAWDAWKVTSGIDSIIASGFTDPWRWAKYSNGLAHAVAVVNWPTLPFSYNFGAWWHSGPLTFNFPFEFIDINYASIAPSTPGELTGANINDRWPAGINAYIYTPIQGKTITNASAFIEVWGTWK